VTSHLFNPDSLLRADYNARFALRAIARSGYSYAFGIEVEHVFRADLETFTVILALARVYFRKVHVFLRGRLHINVGVLDQK
jgi:hypothetical protein